MQLAEFIEETLLSILKGVSGAQGKAAQGKGVSQQILTDLTAVSVREFCQELLTDPFRTTQTQLNPSSSSDMGVLLRGCLRLTFVGIKIPSLIKNHVSPF
jgi:hypothetical protein